MQNLHSIWRKAWRRRRKTTFSGVQDAQCFSTTSCCIISNKLAFGARLSICRMEITPALAVYKLLALAFVPSSWKPL